MMQGLISIYACSARTLRVHRPTDFSVEIIIMRLARTIFAALGVPLLAALPVSRLCASERVPTQVVGHWEASARIIVIWCKQKSLPIAVNIQADGHVTGTVGDATLTSGRFKQNRGWFGRKLNLKTDYIITGHLTGPIVAAEGITRSSVSMPLNFKSGTMAGGLHTSGSKFGGKKRMILSASSLTLTRTNSVGTKDTLEPSRQD